MQKFQTIANRDTKKIFDVKIAEHPNKNKLNSPTKKAMIKKESNTSTITSHSLEMINGINNMQIEEPIMKLPEYPCDQSDKNFYLKRENQVLIHNYGPEMYEYYKYLEKEADIPQGYINPHKFDPSVRTKMVDWMIEVLYAYNSDTPTFFLAVDILDSFIAKTTTVLTNQDIHLIGICSLFIASKTEDIIPLRMSHVKTKIGHNKFSEKEIKKKEKIILDTINFNIITTSTYDFIRTFIFDFCHNNREFVKLLNMSKHIENFENICIFLSKMICHNEEFTVYSHSLRAIACIVAAFDILRSNSRNLNQDSENFMRQWVKLIF